VSFKNFRTVPLRSQKVHSPSNFPIPNWLCLRGQEASWRFFPTTKTPKRRPAGGFRPY
jgi:hypothetical protein